MRLHAGQKFRPHAKGPDAIVVLDTEMSLADQALHVHVLFDCPREGGFEVVLRSADRGDGPRGMAPLVEEEGGAVATVFLPDAGAVVPRLELDDLGDPAWPP